MSKWSSTSTRKWQQPETGNQVARCVRVIELGTQKKEYQGETSWKRQTLIVWELPNNLIAEGDYAGEPFLISKFYTASLNEKANLRHDLESWRGRAFTPEELVAFDQRNILGKPCMLNLIERDGKVRIGSVSAIPKGLPVPPQVNESLFYDIDLHNEDVFAKLSDGIKKIIQQSREWQAAKATVEAAAVETAAVGTAEGDDLIPF